jgi:mannose-6-phosphate isomerase-like protein (cupin superfamily)
LPETQEPPVTFELMPKWVDFQGLQPVACPCGLARRAFHDRADVPYTMHFTEILDQAKPHYHKKMTETYYILECEKDAFLELDGKRVPVVPGVACLIPPGVVHRAIGRMKVLIVVTPKFDSNDEYVIE